MKHSTDELIAIAYRYYPRIYLQDPAYDASTQHDALIEASRAAGLERSRWLTMLQRIKRRAPNCAVDGQAMHLAAAWPAACYPGELSFPKRLEHHDHRLGFQVSFLVPYYVIYSAIYFPQSDYHALVRLQPDEQERPYWDVIAREIESTYRAEPMPPEAGYVGVPGVQPGNRLPGEAMIYDCFFDDCPRLIEESDEERLRRESVAISIASGHWSLGRIMAGEMSPDVMTWLNEFEPALVAFIARRDAGQAAGGPQWVTATDIDRLRRLRGVVRDWPANAAEGKRLARELRAVFA